MPESELRHTDSRALLFDAGIFIGALLRGDPRYAEARPIVEQARRGLLPACTTISILCEVYGALTWEKAVPRHSPREAEEAARLLIEPPSAIAVLGEEPHLALRTLELAVRHGLTARRIHDARHAATALSAGVKDVYTYDSDDWLRFEPDGLQVVGPPSTLVRLGRVRTP
ncbi:MAG: type II toxin-antitoxin system VapC family toxin [Candidatus Schekmanbacteria bacterium]|nr:type II toxin-antitoxin system VapC family toxin [Candidatus Schekmanbacteria bacterium]